MGFVLRRSLPSLAGLLALLIGGSAALVRLGAPAWVPVVLCLVVAVQWAVNPLLLRWLVPADVVPLADGGTSYAVDHPPGPSALPGRARRAIRRLGRRRGGRRRLVARTVEPAVVGHRPHRRRLLGRSLLMRPPIGTRGSTAARRCSSGSTRHPSRGTRSRCGAASSAAACPATSSRPTSSCRTARFVPLLYQQPLPFPQEVFALAKAGELAGQDVLVGLVPVTTTPFVELREVVAAGGTRTPTWCGSPCSPSRRSRCSGGSPCRSSSCPSDVPSA